LDEGTDNVLDLDDFGLLDRTVHIDGADLRGLRENFGEDDRLGGRLLGLDGEGG
jgi:hypothetical protein